MEALQDHEDIVQTREVLLAVSAYSHLFNGLLTQRLFVFRVGHLQWIPNCIDVVLYFQRQCDDSSREFNVLTAIRRNDIHPCRESRGRGCNNRDDLQKRSRIRWSTSDRYG